MKRSRRVSRRTDRRSEHELGKWIWISTGAGESNTYVYFRRSFRLPAKPQAASMCVAASSKYKLFVNGRYVGRGPARSPEGICYYDNHDLVRFLNDGENTIGFLVYYSVDHASAGLSGMPGLNCKAIFELGDQTVEIITDETWQARRAAEWTDPGERMGKSLALREVYDARLRLYKWSQAGFCEDGWQDAVVVDMSCELVPRPIPALREQMMLPEKVVGVFNAPPRRDDASPAEMASPIGTAQLTELVRGSVSGSEALLRKRGSMTVRTPRTGEGVVVVLDFGREVFGDLEIGVDRSSRGYIDIAYSEVLEDGHVQPDRSGARYVDRVILGKGPFVWQSFEPRAFRYVRLEFRRLGRGAVIDYVRVNELSYPVNICGNFECSDPLLNRIWRSAVHTAQLSMQDSFVTFPSVDCSLNWADVRVVARSAYYAFGDTSLFAKELKDVAYSQVSNGTLPAVATCDSESPPADLMLFWVMCVLDYYAYSGDLVLVRELYACVLRLMKWFEKHLGRDGLLTGVPGRLAVAGVGTYDKPIGESTALNCLYYHALRVAGALAEVAGRQAESGHYLEVADRVKCAINRYLYVPERALYADGRVNSLLIEEYGFTTNVFAALFDIADHYRKSAILRQVVNGFLPFPESSNVAVFLLQALYARDMHDVALDYVRKTWGNMIERGATTFWELFDGSGSRCRACFSSPAGSLIAEYVGIKPTLRAHRFTIACHPADLKWARGWVATPGGRLFAEWRASKTKLTLRVEVPMGIKADVHVPGDANSRVNVDGAVQSSRYVVLGEGSHLITVTPCREKPRIRAERDLRPKPQPHVEVLGEVYVRQPGRAHT
ncbi:MAG: family 78 glycoside hydrolase catalytic domain [Armatimonadota bacterium]